MDVEDEHNSYLKYLNDSETPNAYLLENNEVGLFSVEPIFTEMEATDWPQEGFPLLLTNSLINEEECSNSNNSLTARTPPRIAEDLQGLESCIRSEPVQIEGLCEPNQTENQLILSENDVSMPNELTFNENELQLNENCVDFGSNAVNDSEISLQANQNYVLIESNNTSRTQTMQLLGSDESHIPIVAATNSKSITIQNKPKSINDLFSTVIANKCKICSFLCEDLEQIKQHISTKHPEYIFTDNGLTNGVSILLSNTADKKLQQNNEVTIYVCSECHGVCTDKDDLRSHMMQVHGLTTHVDPSGVKSNENLAIEDNKPLKKMSAYLDDVNVGLVKKQERMLQQIKCTIKGCQAGFPTEELRRKHEALHIDNTKSTFQCNECDKVMSMWTVARTHMYLEHGVDFGMIVCPMCNIFKSYRTVRILKHMMIHSEIKPFLCSDCGKSFKQLAQLKNHETLHKLPEDMPTWSKVKKCDKCERFFANSKCLKTHVKTVHENIRPFICNICGHKSSRKAMLELHTRQHTASKPHKCDQCDFRTGDPNSLRKHMMKHVGAVGYQCPYCSYNCIQAGSIKGHLQRKHKNKAGVFACKYCSYTTINETFLRAHERIHEKSLKASTQTDLNVADRAATSQDHDLQTDEETQSCFLNTESQMEETVDNGGITIPAGLEMPLASQD